MGSASFSVKLIGGPFKMSSVGGQVLSSIGNYKLTPTTLGKGSFSKVALANHVILNKQVALKVVTLHKIKDPYVSKNLKREAAIMAKLNHPNIVSLHEVVSVGDFYCLVLDFYPGGNLCDMIGSQEGFKLQEEIARLLFRQILAGLGYLHSKSIIHRDIKLENILLDETHKKAVIADFGLSNFFDANSRLRTRCGSAEYAAPEIFDRQSSYTQGVDMWSLGVSLYAMLSGRLPFDVEEDCSKHQQLIAMINEGFTDEISAGLGAKVSVEARLLVSRLLTVQPNLRIKAKDAAACSWVTHADSLPPVQFSGFQELSESSELRVAGQVRERLHLFHLTPHQVLGYLKSPKGSLGKTAGCFSLLARDATNQLLQPAVLLDQTPAPLPMDDFASLAKSVAAMSRSQPCPPDFWKSTPGRAAREALVKVQPVPLAAKKVEERPLLKEVKEDASRRQQQMLKEEEEKENR